MSARRFVSAAAALLLLGSLAACGAGPGLPLASPVAWSPAVASPPPPTSAPVATSAPPATNAPPTPPLTGSAPPATESLTETIDYGNFGDPTTVDNTWFPLRPGSKLVHTGAGNVDGLRGPRRVVMVVTDLTKVIEGIRTVVVYERDYNDDVLAEAELVFFAQDDDGNVWHFGQYPEEYEDGDIVETPAWIAGQRDAKAGILIKAEPQSGGPSYSQGWGPEVGWADRARVFEADSRTCVPAGCYDGVLVTDEFSRDEPDAHQLKYYAPGLGVERVVWAGALEKEQEVLELVESARLDADGLAAIRTEVLAAEVRAYANSKDVYGQTSPLER
jgi:hypothetical protein